jgi:AcrR family transcriptional regulator
MDQREVIIRRSEKMFLRLGVRSVTMDDVAKELGISKKTLYQFFDNKDALVEAVISTHVDAEKEIMDNICANAADALDEIRTIGAFITATIEDVSPSALFDLQKYYHKSWELLMKKQDDHVISCIMRNLERGRKEGLYRQDLNPEIVARIYGKSTFFVVDAISESASKFTRRELIWELHNYHVHGIATPKGLRLWEQYSSEMKFYDIPKAAPETLRSF